MTRRLFLTIASLAPMQSHPAQETITAINRKSTEYIKLQTLATKRTQYFYPVNDAVLIGWYRGMSKLHTEFAGLFEQLAEALTK